MKECCYKCQRRTCRCHASCEDYIAAKQEQDLLAAKKRSDIFVDRTLTRISKSRRTR